MSDLMWLAERQMGSRGLMNDRSSLGLSLSSVITRAGETLQQSIDRSR